jgi:CHAD domain-containing protein
VPAEFFRNAGPVEMLPDASQFLALARTAARLLQPPQRVSFRLREDESVAKGLNRLVRKQLRAAVERLTSDASDEAIHDARKRIKKVRAILHLAGTDLTGDRALKQLRRGSHALSPLRDMEAMIEVARTLRPSRRTDQTTTGVINRQLTTEKTRLNTTARRNAVRAETARALDRLRRDARDWHWKHIDDALLAKALKRCYKRARNAMKDARTERQEERFHKWRKRLKTLWYGLRLLEDRAPRLRRPIADLKRLETWLGDDHNLLVLQEHFTSATSRSGPRLHVDLGALTDRRHRELRRKALALGSRLLAQPPKVFAQRLRRMWQTRKRPQRSTEAA